jgi:hypothetical protein
MRVSPDQIAEMAQMYASKIISHPISSDEHLSELFEGFELEVELAQTPGEMAPARYARVSAAKNGALQAER